MQAMPLACGFDRATMRYAGTPVAQARCLLRHVEPGGALAPEAPLPAPLARRVGRAVGIDGAALAAYLDARGIAAATVGGAPTGAVARTADGVPAGYFVIHDTSTPNVGAAPLSDEIDRPDWRWNDLTMWAGANAVAHLFVARTGASLTGHDFVEPWRATKAESCVLGMSARGLFLHVELIQPRRSDPAFPAGNDRLAPAPPLRAITDAQLDRLALAYVAASVRRGIWLIPAFHAVIDHGIGDGHDDPQGFPLAAWARRVDALARRARATSR